MGAFSVGGSEFNVVMVRHNDYTASTLYFKPAAPAEGSDEKAFLKEIGSPFARGKKSAKKKASSAATDGKKRKLPPWLLAKIRRSR